MILEKALQKFSNLIAHCQLLQHTSDSDNGQFFTH